MTLWIVWSSLVGALIAGASALVERGAANVGAPRRFVWVAAMAAATVLPFVLVRPSPAAPVRASATVPFLVAPAPAIQPPIAPSTVANPPVDAARLWREAVARGLALAHFADPWVVRAWMLASFLLLGAFVRSVIGLRRLRSRWIDAETEHGPVLVARDEGPAVVGFFSPRVVMPAWALTLARSTRTMLLRHEVEHVRAGDSRVLLGAECLRIVFPWNPALVWMSRQLRLAIEIDCDARVIRAGTGAHEYGRVLLDVSERYGAALPLAASLTEPRLNLEARINALTATRPRRPWLASSPFIAIACAMLAVAALAPKPRPLFAAALRDAVRISSQDAPARVAFQPASHASTARGGNDESSRTPSIANRPRSESARDSARVEPVPAHDVAGGNPPTITFRQIVITPRAGTIARAAAKAKAESLLAAIRDGGDFEAIARGESMDPGSREQGGALPWARHGQMVGAFDRAIFSGAQPGTVLPSVVETPFGFHIIRIDRVEAGRVKASHILIIPALDSSDVARARLVADTVLQRWRADTPYDTLLKYYHDPNEATGAPSAFPFDSLPEAYRKALEELQAGELSTPFSIRNVRSGGEQFVVVQVIERAGPDSLTQAASTPPACPMFIIEGVEQSSACAQPPKIDAPKCDPAGPILVIDGVIQAPPCGKPGASEWRDAVGFSRKLN